MPCQRKRPVLWLIWLTGTIQLNKRENYRPLSWPRCSTTAIFASTHLKDGNGRIARLMVNYILTRHNYPMIVVRSRKEKRNISKHSIMQILEVDSEPSDGAHAGIKRYTLVSKVFHRTCSDRGI